MFKLISFVRALAIIVLAMLGGCTSVHMRKDPVMHEVRVSPQPEEGVVYTIVPIGAADVVFSSIRLPRPTAYALPPMTRGSGQYHFNFPVQPGWADWHQQYPGPLPVEVRPVAPIVDPNVVPRPHRHPPHADRRHPTPPQPAASAAPPKGPCVPGRPCRRP